MEYIILDLEWDSTYYKPKKTFVNQILQIGAVRLDNEFNIIGTFSATVRSSISDKVSSRFAKLTGITSEKMRMGIPLCEAINNYNLFSKGVDVTMTWSNSDLYTIMENEDNIINGEAKFVIGNYLDLQKLVQRDLSKKGYESKNQISLEAAADFLQVSTEEYDLHTALDDCMVCAMLLKISYDENCFKSLLKDTTNPDFYARMRFKPYPISDINDSSIKTEHMRFECPNCKGKTERLGAFKYRNRWFCANFKCKECGFKFNGRVAIKKTFDELEVKHKVCEFKQKRKKNDMQSLSKKV